MPGSRFDPDCLERRDPALIDRLLPLAEGLLRSYFALRVEGLEFLPSGPAVYASNHNGGIFGPDLPCTLVTLWRALGPRAPLYALAHDFPMRQFTALGRMIQRFGAVRASRPNADRILEAGASFLVYPGGDLEAYRHARRRDEVVLGERTGFVRAAQRAGAPIVPVVAHGAHRSAYIFHEGERLAQAMGLKRWARLERFPLALALPWGFAPGPWLPYWPLPFAIRLRVLAPELPRPGDDACAVRERIRGRMQDALDAMAADARQAA
ncbi:MAG TPA: 1-acyl-sn-glycerol-3-phosphate acyltransferase [Polyangiaceae bacterium]|nr:1-acyl-sn-glycerol-3-phosphate acyltransferase [Polyangiaceae bacterium]